MTTALLEPLAVAPRKPDLFYSPGRILHWFAHNRCCGMMRLIPGTCMNDPYDDERIRGTGAEPMQFSGADMHADIIRVWHDLLDDWRTRSMAKSMLCLIYLGPIDRPEKDDTEYQNYLRQHQLAWWQKHRAQFHNVEPEHAVYLAHETARRIAHTLGWRPEPEETA